MPPDVEVTMVPPSIPELPPPVLLLKFGTLWPATPEEPTEDPPDELDDVPPPLDPEVSDVEVAVASVEVAVESVVVAVLVAASRLTVKVRVVEAVMPL